MAGSWRTRREVREQPFAVYDETGLQALLDSFEKRMKRMNDMYLRMMGEHIRDIGTLWPSDVHRLQQIRRMNQNLRYLERRIAAVAGRSEVEIERVFEQVAAADVRMATKILGVQDTSRVMDNPALQRMLRAQARETAQSMKNLSNTTVVSKYYRNAIDEGVSAVQSGVEDYNSAIRRVIREAGQSGLRVTDKGTRVVDYESGYSRRLDTAARMNILDGVRHLNQSVMEEVAHQFGANGVEIDAHMLCAEDHLPYQGGQYSNDEFERIQDGLPRPFGEWNCRHSWHGIILGVSPRLYSDEQLEEMRRFSTETITIDGRTKTRYQWSQEMRRCEVAIRQKKDLATLAKASGDESLQRRCQGAILDLNKYYGELANKTGNKPEYSRTYVSGFKDKYADKKFRLDMDPIRRYLGSASQSHPKELAEIKSRLEELGVQVNEHGRNMCYSPGLRGEPGTINIDPKASISAWMHEAQHAYDDYERGWLGMRLLIDPDTAIEIEDRAYDIEVDFARRLGYNDVVEELIALKEHRRRELRGEFDLK